MKDIFITFEGGEGAGKTTQIQMLHDCLAARGLPVVAVRDPGGTSIAEKIRDIVKSNENHDMFVRTEALLYLAARCEMVDKLVRPHLNRGDIVLCDRFADSTIAYQGFANGLDLADLEQIGNFATGDLVPTLTFYLKIDPALGLSRKASQEALDRVENKGLGYHKQVEAGFDFLAAKHPGRVVVIDAAASLNQIHQIIVDHTNKILEV